MLDYAGIMQKQLLLFLLLSLVLTPVSAKVYKWVAEDGTIQYSDQPHEGAETIKVPKSKPKAGEEAATGEEEEGAELDPASGYKSFSIGEPENNQTIRSDQGVTSLSFFIEPKLQAGHKIILHLDGTKLAGEHTTTRLSLKQLERGTHTIKADLVDETGKTLASTQSVVFHMRKEAVQGIK